MTVDYTSDEARTIELWIAMLAGSATWKALVGAGTAATAKARILESDGGSNPELDGVATNVLGEQIEITASPFLAFALVHADEFPAEERALNCERRTGEIRTRVYCPIVSDDTAPERFRRTRNSAGLIRSECRALFGTTGCLMRGSITLAGPWLPDDTGWLADSALVFDLITTWRA
ncbi:MAG: hypothetical protein H0W72_08370 [Planctomycetes bacterium]|nr:hypothetical protein [Planctomycetota bacterium]